MKHDFSCFFFAHIGVSSSHIRYTYLNHFFHRTSKSKLTVFKTILANYVSNPLFVLPSIVKDCGDEETYNIYQAAKMTAGMESGLYEEDLFEEGLIDDKVLCLIMISKLIEKHGITGCLERQNRKRKQQYRNKGICYGKQQNIYVYNGQAIRIK